MKPKIKNIVVLGGGHGSAVLLSALKDKNVNLTAILTMTDDGGSTGRLRREYGVSALGDIRNCLASLSDSSQKADIFSYRFSKGKLKGHSLGNLFLAAGELLFHDLQASIDNARKALHIQARIYPITLDKADLVYQSDDKKIVGMYKIANTPLRPKPNLFLSPPARISPAAKASIENADVVVIAPGNFYCSITPLLLTTGVKSALKKSKGPVVLVSNLVNQAIHTAGFSPLDYAHEVARLLGEEVIDKVIYNTSKISRDRLKPGETPLMKLPAHADKNVYKGADLLSSSRLEPNPNDMIAHIRSMLEHNGKKLADIILAL